ncbi:MAG: hypothetical protein MRZ86_00070 [Acidaminococcus sp.]|nr:hypothetical protein [Acidaminococcus sp.]MDY5345389.1 hypothetical protein [Eubacteriales bacterium]
MKKNQQFLTATCDVNVASQMINRNLHRQGQIWTAIALIVMCMVPVGMSIIYKTTLNWKLFFTCVGLLIYYLPIGVGEVFTYSYMLGVNGTYLAFVTGNLSNLKIPCVVNAVNIVGTKVGTEEHEIACTISIAVSSIVTVVVILIGVIALAFSGLGTLLSSPQAAFLTPAFGTVAFALFGALGGKYLVKYPKVAIFPFIIMVALTIGLNLLGKGGMAQPATFIFVGVVLCFISAVLWQKHDAKKKAKQELLNLAAAESLKDSASPETISSDESAITTDTAESKDLAENNQSNND